MTTRQLEKNQDEEKESRPLWESKLMIAVVTGNQNDVKTYCKGNAINAKSGWNDSTPLMVAAAHDRVECAEALLKKGANVDAMRPVDHTPSLIFAVDNESHGMLRLLPPPHLPNDILESCVIKKQLGQNLLQNLHAVTKV